MTSFADIVAMVDAKLGLVPRYRQLVKSAPSNWRARCGWMTRHFDIEYHLRHTALPAPGSDGELRKLVTRPGAR